MTRRSRRQAGISDDEQRENKRQKVDEAEPVCAAPAAELDAAEYEGTRSVTAGSDPAEPDALETFEPRHPDLWWCDGNVVVAAKGMSFKVHASILARYSNVFREVLAEKDKNEGVDEDGGGGEGEDRNGEPSEMFQGCRVLRVEDPGEELGALFQVLYDGGVGGFFNWNRPLRFEYLRQVTLLAVKYEIQHIIDEAVARLNYIFPSTFEESRDRHCLEAVVLARKIGASSPPPFIVTALYHCLALNIAALYYPAAAAAAARFLSLQDHLTCVRARDTLVAAAARARPLKSPVCAAPAACRASMDVLVRSGVRAGLFADAAVLDAVCGALGVHAEHYPQHRLCGACSSVLVRDIDARRREVFAELGAVFGVKNWPAARVPPTAQA
ncbi:hypothetical protein PsYK624_163720 [Phanerochaete sordida]|uniref:BTB domain-containing protein n=1 Tax=Phanerochaete sordida TaxID=48140 RepID=A0A9P3LNE0_9APHY|nr:hypothetical protein PsYK624_163720 [Phanerochaete sordida]